MHDLDLMEEVGTALAATCDEHIVVNVKPLTFGSGVFEPAESDDSFISTIS